MILGSAISPALSIMLNTQEMIKRPEAGGLAEWGAGGAGKGSGRNNACHFLTPGAIVFRVNWAHASLRNILAE